MVYRRLKVCQTRKNPETTYSAFDLLPTSPMAQVRFPPQQFQPKLRVSNVESSGARPEALSLGGEL